LFRKIALVPLILSVYGCGGGSDNPPTNPPTNPPIPPAQNTAPVAKIADLQEGLFVNSQVALSAGESSDAEGQSLQFSWTLEGPQGTAVELENASAADLAYTPTMDGAYVATVTVTDTEGASNTVSKTFNVMPAKVLRISTLEHIQVGRFSTAHAKVTSFADEPSPYPFVWQLLEKPQGSQLSLSNTTGELVRFRPDVEGEYVLRVNGASQSEHVTISAHQYGEVSPNARISVSEVDYAHALQTELLLGESITLHDRSTDIDSQNITSEWSLTSSPDNGNGTLSDNTGGSVNFTANQPGLYEVTLTTTDGSKTDSAVTHVNVVTSKVAPVVTIENANTGFYPNEAITFFTDSTTNDSGYQWRVLSQPEGSTLSLDDASQSTAELLPQVSGTYTIAVSQFDGSRYSQQDTHTFSVADNHRPIASFSFSSRNAINNDTQQSDVRLRGLALDEDANSTFTYQWSVVSQPEGAEIYFSAPNSRMTNFNANKDGDYLVQLVVSDGITESYPYTDIINVSANSAPSVQTTNASLNIILLGDTLVLDASPTTDPEGDPLTFLWNVTDSSGDDYEITNANTHSATFTATELGSFYANVTVSDGKNTASHSLTINVIESQSVFTVEGVLIDTLGRPMEDIVVRAGGHAVRSSSDGSFTLPFVMDSDDTFPVTVSFVEYFGGLTYSRMSLEEQTGQDYELGEVTLAKAQGLALTAAFCEDYRGPGAVVIDLDVVDVETGVLTPFFYGIMGFNSSRPEVLRGVPTSTTLKAKVRETDNLVATFANGTDQIEHTLNEDGTNNAYTINFCHRD